MVYIFQVNRLMNVQFPVEEAWMYFEQSLNNHSKCQMLEQVVTRINHASGNKWSTPTLIAIYRTCMYMSTQRPTRVTEPRVFNKLKTRATCNGKRHDGTKCPAGAYYVTRGSKHIYCFSHIKRWKKYECAHVDDDADETVVVDIGQ